MATNYQASEHAIKIVIVFQIKDLTAALSNERGSNASSLQELKESRNRIEMLMSKVSDLEGANLNLNQKISDLAQNMDDIKSAHRAQVHNLQYIVLS
jgi:chromosome segregation ATPase